MKLGLTWEPAVHKRVKAVILYLAESDRGLSRPGHRAVNERTAVRPVVDGQAAIECLDAIAQAGERCVRRSAVDPDVERQRAIGLDHTNRCLGPG